MIAEIPIPVPKDRSVIDEIGKTVLQSIEELECSIESSQAAKGRLQAVLPFTATPGENGSATDDGDE